MLSDARVEVVLINYKRPQNIAQIVNAFRNQTVGCHVTLIDAAPSVEFSLPEEVRQSVDHLFTWTHEFGPYNRYVPIAAYSREFTYFHDDDMLPGSRVIEHFTRVADSVTDFGVLGQMGRFVDATGAYIARDVRRTKHVVPVDIVVRGYFVPTKHLPAVMQQRLNLDLLPDPSLEDDLLLCTAMNMIHGLTNYISPADDDPETRMNQAGLRSAFARQGRGIHFEERTEFCRRAIDAGWVPLSKKEKPSRQNRAIVSRTPANGPLPTNPLGNGGKVSRHGINAPAANCTARQIVESETGSQDASGSGRSGFNVNDYWLKRGQTYINEDRLYTEPYRLQEEFIIDGLSRSEVPIQRVLEIGCGFGRITKRIAEAYPTARITAVDISPDQLRNAREYCADFADRIEFFEYDLYSGTPLPGQSYDTAIAIEVLMHHPYDAVSQFIERLTRVADRVVNYDWSEEWSASVARHVWVHDYAEIYRNFGFTCEVLTEPQKFRGQQQKLFVATKKQYKEVADDRLGRTSGAVLSSITPKPAILGQPLCQASFEYRFGTDDNSSSSSSETITLEGAVKNDHLIRVINRTQAFYEHDLLQHIALNVPQGGIYIDVGAYIGNHSVFFAKFLADFLVAIEPISLISRIWERNVRRNGILDYALFEVALGPAPGLGRPVFPEVEDKLGMTRIELAENVVELEDCVSIVPVDTLDRVLGSLPSDIGGLPVSFIKIDVEGAELDVLMGATELLRTHRPRISAELHNSSAYSAVDAYLRGFGYVERGRFGISPTYFFSHVSHDSSAS
jgi:FkbM family methyltransferase